MIKNLFLLCINYIFEIFLITVFIKLYFQWKILTEFNNKLGVKQVRTLNYVKRENNN